MNNSILRWIKWLLIIHLLLLSACTTHKRYTPSSEEDGPPKGYVDISKIPDAVPKAEGYSKYGNPSSYRALGKNYKVMPSSSGYRERGLASWYGTKFHHHRTSSGEAYNMYGMTAAHKTLPIPCYVRVTNLQNGKQVIVKVNDRGPFRHNRIIDLSYVAAKKLEIYGHGTGLVEVAALDTKQRYAAAPTVTVNKNPKLFLQMGAFSRRENAEKLAHEIQRFTSQPVRLQPNRQGFKTIYRVQIGPFANVAAIDAAHSKIRGKGLGDSLTVIQ